MARSIMLRGRGYGLAIRSGVHGTVHSALRAVHLCHLLSSRPPRQTGGFITFAACAALVSSEDKFGIYDLESTPLGIVALTEVSWGLRG